MRFGRHGQFPDAVFVLQGLICYKPSEQEGCFLREMDKSDYDNVHALLRESPQKVLARQHVSGLQLTALTGYMRLAKLHTVTEEEDSQFALSALPGVS